MKSWLSGGMLTAAIALPALSGAAWAQDVRCSNATLNGEYAYGVTAYTPPGQPNGPPRVALGIHYFDGKGTLLQQDYRGDTSPPEFSPPDREEGTYQVNPGCTGSAVVNLNYPVSTGSTGVINVLFVIGDGGRHIHEVVSQFTPPDSPDPSRPRPASTTGRSLLKRTSSNEPSVGRRHTLGKRGKAGADRLGLFDIFSVAARG